jgi:hypothetical protein
MTDQRHYAVSCREFRPWRGVTYLVTDKLPIGASLPRSPRI